MGLVSKWLKTVGLGHAVPAFRSAGINSPESLAQLKMSDFDNLGVTDWNDKRKLLYLVQRIQVAREDNEKNQNGDNDRANSQYSHEDEEYYSQDDDQNGGKGDRNHLDDANEDQYVMQKRMTRTPSQKAAEAMAQWTATDQSYNDETNYEDDDVYSQVSSYSSLPSPPLHNDHDQNENYDSDYESEDNEDLQMQREYRMKQYRRTFGEREKEEETRWGRERENLLIKERDRPSSRSMRLLRTASTSSRESYKSRDNHNHKHHSNNSHSSYERIAHNEEFQPYGRQYKSPQQDEYESSQHTALKHIHDYNGLPPTSPNFYQRVTRRGRYKEENKYHHFERDNIHGKNNGRFQRQEMSHEYNSEKQNNHTNRSKQRGLNKLIPIEYAKNEDYMDRNLTGRSDLSLSQKTRPHSKYQEKNYSSYDYSNHSDENAEINDALYWQQDEEDKWRKSLSPPTRSSTSRRRMSQRLREKNLRRRMMQNREKDISSEDDPNFPDDNSRTSYNSVFTGSQNGNHSDMENNKMIHNYNEKQEFHNDLHYNENNPIDVFPQTRKKSSNRGSIPIDHNIFTSPILTRKESRRRSSSMNTHQSILISKSGDKNDEATKFHSLKYNEKQNFDHKKFPSPGQDTNDRSDLTHYIPDEINEREEPIDDKDNKEGTVSRRNSNMHQESQHDLPSESNKNTSSQRLRLKSKIQNPSISLRNGKKMLSSIPSEKIAPMSPLAEISYSNYDSKSTNKIDVKNKEIFKGNKEHFTDEKNKSRSRNRRQSSVGSGEYRSSSREARSKSRESSRRLSAPIPQLKNESSSPDIDESFSKQDRRTILLENKRLSTGSISSVSTSSRKRQEGNKIANQNSRSPIKNQRPPTRSLKRPVSRQSSFASENDSKTQDDQSSINNSKQSSPVFVHGLPKEQSWSTQVSQLREDIVNEYCAVEQTVQRDEDDDNVEMRIRVIIRKRPMSKKEASIDDVDIIHPIDGNGFGRVVVYQPKTRVDLTKEVETIKFAFDNAVDENSNNSEIYERSIRNLIPGVFEGQWASVFAYGQTGSGKTFTMMGCSMTGKRADSHQSKNTANEANQGLYYLAARDVFHLAKMEEYKHLSIGVSLFEIYGGKLFDLLSKRKAIKCLEDHKGKVCFPGLSEHSISSPSNLLELIEAGALNRSTGTTSANADSSRSHAVLMLSLRKRVGRNGNVEHGRLTFIDLAGSERGADTAKACRTTRMEGAEINTSLLALKEVIRALATGDSMKHIPFRGSKLTQVLKESFVGKNSRTVMIACVAPNMNNCEHTLNTLRYADRVKERDSETGKLSEKIMAASKIKKKSNRDHALSLFNRPSTAPATSLERQLSIERIDKANSSLKSPLTYDDDIDWSSEDDPEDDIRYSEDEEIQSDQDIHLQHDKHIAGFVSDATPNANLEKNKLKEVSSSLIAAHRDVMSGMLTTVKHEMALVNCTDADRSSIEDYLVELEQVLQSNQSMITKLRESLLEYYAAREEITNENNGKNSNSVHSVMDDDGSFSDDTFEDLRD